MSKILIIRNSNFSKNALKQVDILNNAIYSPFNENEIINVHQTVLSGQYMFEEGGKCVGYIIPFSFNNFSQMRITTTNAYPGKELDGIENAVGDIYYSSMNITNVNITQIPSSTYLNNSYNPSFYRIQGNLTRTFDIPNTALGAVIYVWINDEINPVTPNLFNQVISSIELF